MTLEVLCTAVSERADLFIETMDTMLANLDVRPTRFIVHEDVRPGSSPGGIANWLIASGIPFTHHVTKPSRGLGPAMLWCFRQAVTPIVFYTQEDWRFVRPVPVARCMEIMQKNGLNHVRFNKRKTMRAKHEDTPHPWYKKEVEFLDEQGVIQKLCVSDHFYTQASLWRVAPVMGALTAHAERAPQANAFVAAFNAEMNLQSGRADRRSCMDQDFRHQHLKTYIWGGVGEPAFIQHLGSVRTTGPIEHTAEIKATRRPGRK